MKGSVNYYGLTSLVMYVSSFFFYAYYDEGLECGVYGFDCFKFGLFYLLPVIIMDVYNLSVEFLWIAIWLANPFYWIAAFCHFRHEHSGDNFILWAIFLGLLFLLVKDVDYGNVLTESLIIGEKMIGYYLWMASFVVMAVAIFKDLNNMVSTNDNKL